MHLGHVVLDLEHVGRDGIDGRLQIAGTGGLQGFQNGLGHGCNWAWRGWLGAVEGPMAAVADVFHVAPKRATRVALPAHSGQRGTPNDAQTRKPLRCVRRTESIREGAGSQTNDLECGTPPALIHVLSSGQQSIRCHHACLTGQSQLQDLLQMLLPPQQGELHRTVSVRAHPVRRPPGCCVDLIPLLGELLMGTDLIGAQAGRCGAGLAASSAPEMEAASLGTCVQIDRHPNLSSKVTLHYLQTANNTSPRCFELYSWWAHTALNIIRHQAHQSNSAGFCRFFPSVDHDAPKMTPTQLRRLSQRSQGQHHRSSPHGRSTPDREDVRWVEARGVPKDVS